MSTDPSTEAQATSPLREDLVLPPAQQSVWAYWRERALYWSPVFALMVLFAQIAFLGLRPALAEERRMDIAERGMQERLRRLRIHPPTAQ
jgi:hypothetical protein